MNTENAAVSAAERVPVLDLLRGFALFGVLVVNMYTWIPATSVWPVDPFVHTAVDLVFEDKSWPLLSLLFGLGFALQLDRARSRGSSIVWPHLRRMAVLYGFGILLLSMFEGNPILIRYAAAGLFLLPFAWMSPKWVLAAVVAFFAFSTVDSILYQRFRTPPTRPSREVLQARQRELASQTLVTQTVWRFQRTPRLAFSTNFWPGRQTEIFTMFLLGMYLGKRRAYVLGPEHRPRLKRAAAVFLLAGIPLAVTTHFWTVNQATPLVGRIGHRTLALLGADLQSLGYAALIGLFCLRVPLSVVWRWVAAYGRLPLTNYFGQWFLMRILFDRFFFALVVGPAAGLGIAVAIFIFQAALSWFWLRRFQYGPFEWVWKTLTYLRFHPFRAAAQPLYPALSSQDRQAAIP